MFTLSYQIESVLMYVLQEDKGLFLTKEGESIVLKYFKDSQIFSPFAQKPNWFSLDCWNGYILLENESHNLCVYDGNFKIIIEDWKGYLPLSKFSTSYAILYSENTLGNILDPHQNLLDAQLNRILSRPKPTHFNKVRKILDDLSNITVDSNIVRRTDFEIEQIYWEFDLNNLINELPQWLVAHEDHQGMRVRSQILQYRNAIVFGIGQTVFEQRLVSLDIETGKLNWIAKDYHSTGVNHIYQDKAYILYGEELLSIDLENGSSTLADLRTENQKNRIKMLYNFEMKDNYILGVEDKTLKFGLFNVESMKYEFVHQFKKGKDINKKVWQIEIPKLNGNQIYVLDSEKTLHIFSKE